MSKNNREAKLLQENDCWTKDNSKLYVVYTVTECIYSTITIVPILGSVPFFCSFPIVFEKEYK